MSDSKNTEIVDQTVNEVSVEELETKTARPAKAKAKSGKAGFFSQVKGEFKKIIWPSRQSLFRRSVAVILSTIALGVIITLVDLLVRYIFEFILV